MLNEYLSYIQEVIDLTEIELDATDRLIPLYKKFGKETKEISFFKYKDQPYEKWLKKLNKGKTKILVAVDNNKDIGFIIGQIDNRNYGFESGWIEALYLDKKYRNKGVADLMFKAIVKWIKDNNQQKVRLKTTGANKRAQKFYKKMGFVPELITMRNKESKNV